MPQKTRTTVTVQWNAAIDPMYSGNPKKHRNMAIFAPAAITHFSCSDYYIFQENVMNTHLIPFYSLFQPFFFKFLFCTNIICNFKQFHVFLFVVVNRN